MKKAGTIESGNEQGKEYSGRIQYRENIEMGQ